MQIAETKTRTAANKTVQKKRQPFFNKEGRDSFFSKSNQHQNSFFSPSTLQPKITIGKPNDKYEVEADAMADKVVQRLSKGQKVNDGNSFFRSPKDSLHKKPIFESNAEEFENREVLQKKCSDCNTDIKLQKQEEEEEEIQAKLSHRSEKLNGVERVQMKSTGRPDHLSGIEGRLISAKDGGRTMAPDLQRSMGDAFGADFSSVEIHTSENAVQMNRDLSAQAFTHGRNIYFNQGKYRPETASGKHLLAHELTHTIQQGATSKSVNAKFETSHDSTLRTNGTKSPKLAGFADERENTIQKKISKVQKVPKPASRSDLPSNNGNNITRNSIRYNQNLVQSKKDLEKDKDIEEKEAAGIQAKMDNLLWDSGRDQKDEFMKGRSWEEAQSEKMILFKRDSHLQLSSNGSNDEASMRDRIVEVAKKQIGKVEARRDDGAGRRVGADRLLEYFHLAAPDQWSDAVIEQSRYTMEAKQFPHWCGIFSVYVIKKAGIDVGDWKIGTGVSQFNSLQQTDMPQKGDIGYIHEPYRHHCIIKEVNGDSITSIDGNSGTKSEVLERVRPISKYTGFFTAFTGSEKYIQKKEETADFTSNANTLEQELNSTTGKGAFLDTDTRDQMETGFEIDFGAINIHTDNRAVEMNQNLGAHAFTHGNDIYFNEGKYRPETSEGKHLLAHELTHTVQQGKTTSRKIQRSPLPQEQQDVLGSKIDLMILLVKKFLPEYEIDIVGHLETQRADLTTIEILDYEDKLRDFDQSIESLGEIIRVIKILPAEDSVLFELIDAYKWFKTAIEDALWALLTNDETEKIRALLEAQANYLNQFTTTFITLSGAVLGSLPSADTIDQEGYFVQGVYLTEVNGRMEFASTTREYATLSSEIASLQEEINQLGDLNLMSIGTPEIRLGFLMENGDKLMELMQRVKALTLIHICFNIGNQFLELIYGDYQQRWTDLVMLLRLRDKVIKPLLQASSNGNIPTDDQIASAQRITGSPADFVSAAEGKDEDVARPDSLFAEAGGRIHDVIEMRGRMEIFIAIASTVVGLRAMTMTANALRGASGLVRFTLSSLAFTSASTATRSILTGQLPSLGQVAKQAGMDLLTFGLLKGAHQLVGLRFGGVQNVPEGLLHGTTFATLWAWSSAMTIARSDEELSMANIGSAIQSSGIRLAIELPIIILINKGLDGPKITSDSTELGKTVEQEWNSHMDQTKTTARELKSWLESSERAGKEGTNLLGRLVSQFTTAKGMLPRIVEAGTLTRSEAKQVGDQMDEFIQLGGNAKNAIRLGIKPASDYGFFYQGRVADVDMFLRQLTGQGVVESFRTSGETGEIFEVNYSDGSIRFFFPEGSSPSDTVIDIDMVSETVRETAPEASESTQSTALVSLRNFSVPEVNQIALSMKTQGTPEIIFWLARPDVNSEVGRAGTFISADMLSKMISDSGTSSLLRGEQADSLRAWYESGYESYEIGGDSTKTLRGFTNFLNIIKDYYGTLDIAGTSEAQAIVRAYGQSAEGSNFEPIPERGQAEIGLPGSYEPKPYTGPGDYLSQNGFTDGDFIQARFDEGTWIVRVQNGQVNRAWQFERRGYPPTTEVNLQSEIRLLTGEVNALDAMDDAAPGRESAIETLTNRYNKLSFLAKIRGDNPALSAGIDALLRAQRYVGGESPRPRFDAPSDLQVRREALIDRKNEIRQRATLAGILDNGIIREAIARRPGAVTRAETFEALESDFQAAEQVLNDLSQAALDRAIKRIGAQELQKARSGELSSLTDQEVGDVLNIVAGRHGIGAKQIRALLFGYKEGLRLRRILEFERSAGERNLMLETFADLMDAGIPGARGMMAELLSSANKWRGGIWAFDYIRDHNIIDQIAKFEARESVFRDSDPTSEAVRIYDIVLKDGRRLEMKDWTRWFPSSLKSQFKRDVLIRTNNFNDPYGLYEMQYLFRWPGPQIYQDRSLSTEATAQEIRNLLSEGLEEVMGEEFVDFATQDLMYQIFEHHVLMVEIVEGSGN